MPHRAIQSKSGVITGAVIDVSGENVRLPERVIVFCNKFLSQLVNPVGVEQLVR